MFKQDQKEIINSNLFFVLIDVYFDDFFLNTAGIIINSFVEVNIFNCSFSNILILKSGFFSTKDGNNFIVLKDSYFENITTQRQGGIINLMSSDEVEIQNCSFLTFSSQTEDGGAFYLNDNNSISIKFSLFYFGESYYSKEENKFYINNTSFETVSGITGGILFLKYKNFIAILNSK